MAKQRPGDLVRIATAPNETFGLMWQEILRDEGIESMLRSGGTGYAYTPNILNEQYLYVLAEDAEFALEILDAYTADGDEDDDVTAI